MTPVGVESPVGGLNRREGSVHCPRAPTLKPSNKQRAPTQEPAMSKVKRVSALVSWSLFLRSYPRVGFPVSCSVSCPWSLVFELCRFAGLLWSNCLEWPTPRPSFLQENPGTLLHSGNCKLIGTILERFGYVMLRFLLPCCLTQLVSCRYWNETAAYKYEVYLFRDDDTPWYP